MMIMMHSHNLRLLAISLSTIHHLSNVVNPSHFSSASLVFSLFYPGNFPSVMKLITRSIYYLSHKDPGHHGYVTEFPGR